MAHRNTLRSLENNCSAIIRTHIHNADNPDAFCAGKQCLKYLDTFNNKNGISESFIKKIFLYKLGRKRLAE